MTETLNATANGHEIAYPRPVADGNEFRSTVAEWGINGLNPLERVRDLQKMSEQDVAFMLIDVNRRLQGSDETLVSDSTMKLYNTNGGEPKETLQPADRHAVFTQLLEDIRNVPAGTSPARIGDALALGVVLLHPFHDGNGRTARTLGLLFRDEFDTTDFASDYEALSESRDIARKRGGKITISYVPILPEAADRSNPEDVSSYLRSVLQSEPLGSYDGPYGQA